MHSTPTKLTNTSSADKTPRKRKLHRTPPGKLQFADQQQSPSNKKPLLKFGRASETVTPTTFLDIPGTLFPYMRTHVLNKLMARIKKERGCYAVQAATDINVGDYAYLNFDLKGFRHSGSCLAKKDLPQP